MGSLVDLSCKSLFSSRKDHPKGYICLVLKDINQFHFAILFQRFVFR